MICEMDLRWEEQMICEMDLRWEEQMICDGRGIKN